jgi:hypothetical protein
MLSSWSTHNALTLSSRAISAKTELGPIRKLGHATLSKLRTAPRLLQCNPISLRMDTRFQQV